MFKQGGNKNSRRRNQGRRCSRKSMEALQRSAGGRSEMLTENPPNMGSRSHLLHLRRPSSKLCSLPSHPGRPAPRRRHLPNPTRILHSIRNAKHHHLATHLRPLNPPNPPQTHQQRRRHYPPPENGNRDVSISDYNGFIRYC